MGNVPIFTYLHKNTFGIVSEAFKPSIAGAATMTIGGGIISAFIVGAQIAMIIVGILLIPVVLWFITSWLDDIEKRNNEAYHTRSREFNKAYEARCRRERIKPLK